MDFKIWKTVKLGTGLRTGDDFRRALQEGGFCVGNRASDIIEKPAFTTAAEETEVDLIKVTDVELGFKNGARRDQIYDRAKQLGLELCPAEVGPQLRLQYENQPKDELIYIAMEPIIDSRSRPSVFSVVSCGWLWIRGQCSDPDEIRDPDDLWVFVRPRK